uniref:Transposase n=1 Tax=Cacopsylla melanoneura TaxID=428564 RepID=A0A8D8Q675_9HEMI
MTIFYFSSALDCLTCFFISSSPFLLKNYISFLLFLCPKYRGHYSELTIAQITSKYGVHATQISNWKKQGLELLVQGFKSKTQSADPNEQELIKNLYEQIGQLSVESDWLKKICIIWT